MAFQKFFEQTPEIKPLAAEEKKEEEKLVDQNMKENPKSFVSWFEGFKNSISNWPEKFFKNKALKNSIIYASIPFAVLKATALEVKAEDVVSEFINQSIISEKINKETNAFSNLSEILNKVIEEKTEKTFDFGERMNLKIKEANDYVALKTEPRDIRVKKILNNGRLNFKEAARVFPEIFLAKQLSLLVHETGHAQEATEQGAKNVKIRLTPFGGYTEYSAVKNKTAVTAAGIKADKEYGEFLVNNLRETNPSSQLLAIMALAAKSDGMKYALATNFFPDVKKMPGNDIVNYAKETNTPLSELTIGLVADFILDRDNWQLMKMALGQDGVKIPKTTLAPMYELGEQGSIIGLKFKSVW